MKKISFIFCLLAFYFAFGQDSTKISGQLNELVLTEKNGKLKIDAEKQPIFPLGTDTFRNILLKNFRTEKISDSSDIHCDLLFVIDKEGNISDIRANGTNKDFNNEAVLALSQVKDKWIPAKLNGVPVKYLMKVPLDMKFSNEESIKPKFLRGEDTFKKLIVNNLKIKDIQGQKSCTISFVVDYNGNVRNVDTRGKDRRFNKDVKQAVSKITEKWSPKILHNVPISSVVEIPFNIN